MSKLVASVLAVRPGHSRVPVVWLAPAPVHEYDQHSQVQQAGQRRRVERIARAAAVAPAPVAVRSSAGQWVEREPNVFARQRVAIPVTVGSHLR